MKLIAGVDEAGRGTLAGSVCAAAVILPNDHTIVGLTDSKKLTPNKREIMFSQIIEQAVCYSICFVDELIIDEINILQASLLAMKNAIDSLKVFPDKVLVDGNKVPDVSYPVEAIIKGDSLHESISAASILAKVSRDRQIVAQDKLYPEYGFAQHKGYPTKMHLEALFKYGVCKIHRKSYKPVKKYLK